METENSEMPVVLTDSVLSNMKLFCDVARENGSTISLQDLIALTSVGYSEKQLAESWENYSVLSSRYMVASGIVLDKTQDFTDIVQVKGQMSARHDRASSNIAYAHQFGILLNRAGSPFKVLSISGSTSYLSVSETDDLDFFCIAKGGAMWPSFVRSLILARAFRATTKYSPWICLSYVSDEEFVRREFFDNQNGLFARDALSTRVIQGEKYFRHLLKENSWMASYFPKLYSLRIRPASVANQEFKSKRKSAGSFERILNLFLYHTAGSYIKLKSYLLNRRFSRDRKFSSLFHLRIGLDHCIYESADYLRLRKLYSGLARKDEKLTARP
jgi:hypothetical protein